MAIEKCSRCYIQDAMGETEQDLIILDKVLTRTDLTGDEKILYSQILFFCKGDGSCYATNEYFAKRFGRSVRQIQRYLQSLYDKKLIMYQRTSVCSSKRVVVLYNKRTIDYFENGVLPDTIHLDYKK